MTLKNNKAPLIRNIKLCASFHHMWIHTRVTVRKRLSWVLTSVALTFDLWPWPFACITSVIGNNSWKFHDDTMRGTLWKRCKRRTDWHTDGQKCSQSCLVAAKNVPTQDTIATNMWAKFLNNPSSVFWVTAFKPFIQWVVNGRQWVVDRVSWAALIYKSDVWNAEIPSAA